LTTVTGRSGERTELLRACLPALQVPEDQATALRPRPPPLWTASDALAHLTRLLDVLPDGSSLTAYLPDVPQNAPTRVLRCRAAIASTLIAGLERARDGALVLDQDADWMPIRVTRRADGNPLPGDAAPPD
jgi:segregation and condensation protein A